MVLKLVALVAVISTLYMSEVFFEKVFVTRPWKALFVTTDDDIHEWWFRYLSFIVMVFILKKCYFSHYTLTLYFRWKLDRYSIVYGSLFSLAIIIGGKLKLYDDSNHSCLWPRAIAGTDAILKICLFFLQNLLHSCAHFIPWIFSRFIIASFYLVPVSIASLIGLGSYTVFSFLCRNKADGNEIHPYISFVPIVR